MRLRSAFVLTFAVAAGACERGREPARPDPATPPAGTASSETKDVSVEPPPTSSASAVVKRPRRVSKGDTEYVRGSDGTCTAATWSPCPEPPPGKPTMPCNPPPVVPVKCPMELQGEESEFGP